MSFHVMQPGSSVATSLMPGEAVPKHVALLKVTGKEFKVEPIRLTSVRPFVMKEIVLADERPLKNIWKKDNHRSEITRHLHTIVDELIEEARQEWIGLQESFDEETGKNEKGEEVPRPLIRLRVEYTAPDGGHFDIDNPQRISNRFREQVANINDVVQFYRKKKSATRKNANDAPEMPDDAAMEKMEQMSLDSIKVEKLVKEFLTAQSLTILPQNTFGDAVSQFVDKDDKHSMEMFVDQSLTSQLKHLLNVEEFDEDGIADEMETYRSKLEELFAAGVMKKPRRTKVKPKPDGWDTDMDGDWEDQPGAIVHSEAEDDEDDNESVATTTATRGASRGRGRSRGGRGGSITTRKTAAAPKKAAAPARGGRGKKKVVEEEDDDEESDVQMVLNDDDEDDEENLFVKPPARSKAKAPASRAAPKAPAASARKPAPRQSTLNFSQPTQPTQTQRPSARAAASKQTIEIVSCGADVLLDYC
jgi:double-strand break repair protein MRE11